MVKLRATQRHVILMSDRWFAADLGTRAHWQADQQSSYAKQQMYAILMMASVERVSVVGRRSGRLLFTVQ